MLYQCYRPVRIVQADRRRWNINHNINNITRNKKHQQSKSFATREWIDNRFAISMLKNKFVVITIIMLTQGSLSVAFLASNLGKRQRILMRSMGVQTFDDIISSPKSKTAKLVQNLLTKYVITTFR